MGRSDSIAFASAPLMWASRLQARHTALVGFQECRGPK
jgi:hypothetical protein